jgi:hypothetical protein
MSMMGGGATLRDSGVRDFEAVTRRRGCGVGREQKESIPTPQFIFFDGPYMKYTRGYWAND